MTTPISTPEATPTGPPSPTPNSQLSLIIGLPVGVGLAAIGLGACLLWLTCSAYCENKDHTRTASSNLVGAFLFLFLFFLCKQMQIAQCCTVVSCGVNSDVSTLVGGGGWY